ncbi:MAG: TolC family protein [Nitrospinota bacterium]
MGKKLLFIIGLFTVHCSLSTVSLAEVKTPREEKIESKNALFLSLKETVALALKNNLEISIERINPKITETEITRNEAEFDYSLNASTSVGKNRTPSASAFASPPEAENEAFSVSAGIKKRSETGTNYQVSVDTQRTMSNSKFQGLKPQYTANLNLSITQNLLKDFGVDINTAKIKIASNNRDITLNQLKDKGIKIISQVEEIYWDLVFAIEDLRVKRESLKLAQDLERRIRIQVEVGTMAPIEITQGQAEVAMREEDVIISQNRVESVEDRLKKIINIENHPFTPPFEGGEGLKGGGWDLAIVPTDAPKVLSEDVVLEENIKVALENRPEYKQAEIDLKNKNIQVEYKKNQLHPSLDLVGSLKLNGISGDTEDVVFAGSISRSGFGGDYFKSYDRLISGNFYDWSIGLSLQIPLGNRMAVSSYTAAKLDIEKGLKSLKNLEHQISVEVREAVRSIETNKKRVNTTVVSRRLAEEKLSAEEKKYAVGMSTSFNVLEYQRDLIAAKTREIAAIIDYNKSLVNLERVKGTTLEKSNVEL